MTAGEGTGQPPVPYNPETGEVIKVPEERPVPHSLRQHVAPRQQQPVFDTGEKVYAEIQREMYKLELLGQRLTDVRRMLHGYYDDSGNYVAGAIFEYAEVYDAEVRRLYARCHDTSVPKDKRPKWPGEDVRISLVNEFIPEESRQWKQALEGELKTLEEYRRITEHRLSGLQSLLGWRKAEALLASQQQG